MGWSAAAARTAAGRCVRPGCGLGRGLGRGRGRWERGALGARQDQDLADHERRVVQLVELDDPRLGDAVLGRQRFERVGRRNRHDDTVDRRDSQLLADVELVLGLEIVGPPYGLHRDPELAGDVDQGVPGLDPVDLDQVRAVLDVGVGGITGEQRAVVQDGRGRSRGHCGAGLGRDRLGDHEWPEARRGLVDAAAEVGDGVREAGRIHPVHVAADRDPDRGPAALGAADGALRRVREEGEQRGHRDDGGDGDRERALGGREGPKRRGERGAQRADGEGEATLEPGLEPACEADAPAVDPGCGGIRSADSAQFVLRALRAVRVLLQYGLLARRSGARRSAERARGRSSGVAIPSLTCPMWPTPEIRGNR